MKFLKSVVLFVTVVCTAHAFAVQHSIAPSPSSLSFGAHAINTTSSLPFSIVNTGTRSIQIQNVSVTGSGPFKIVGWVSKTVLRPGQSLRLSVAFVPSNAGSFTGGVYIDADWRIYAKMQLNGSATSTAIAPVGVSVSPSSTTVPLGGTQQFLSSVTGTTNTAVIWSVNGVQGGNASLGTISGAGLYQAPTTAPATTSLSIRAASLADSTKAGTAILTLTPATTSVSVSISPSSASVAPTASQRFSATVSGTSNTGVSWSVNGVTGGNSSLGTVASDGTYSAPACPVQNAVTVTARSTYDSSAAASAAVSLGSSATSGNDYYVAATGSDSNDGSPCRPWATIQHADKVAQPGDTIHVAPGTYGTYSSAIVTYSNGTPSAHIRFVSDTRWGARIIGTAADVWAVGGSFEDIEGFDISSGPNTNQIIQSSGYSDRFIGNRIHDMKNPSCMSGAGIHFGTGSSYNAAIGNVIYNIGLSPSAGCNQAHGIYVSTNNNFIEDNVIFNCGDLGIHLWGNGPSYNRITNNTVFGNWRGIIIGSSGSTATGNYVANNILYKNLGPGMYEEGPVSSNTITNNLNYGNGSAWGLTSDSARSTVSGDPMFVNFTGNVSGDYHLQSGSPAINAGTSTYAPPTDAGGATVGSAPDIGAYQYGGAPAAWPFM